MAEFALAGDIPTDASTVRVFRVFCVYAVLLEADPSEELAEIVPVDGILCDD